MRQNEDSYFSEPQFKRLLQRYIKARHEGRPIYMDADELTDIAEYYMTNGNEGKANEAIELAVSLHPDSVDPQIFLARQEMFHDNLDEAHRICDAIGDQDDREVTFLNAELLIREERFSESVEYLLGKYDTLDDEPDMFLYDCACIYLDYELYEEAQVFTKRLSDDYPDKKAEAEVLTVDILMGQEDYKLAIPILNAILDRNPYDIDAWINMANAYKGLSSYPEAVECADYVLAMEPNNRKAVIVKAYCLFHMGQCQEASDLCDTYLQEHPEDAVVLSLCGSCHLSICKYETAKEYLETAAALGVDDERERIHLYMQLAFALSKLKKKDEALAAVDVAEGLINSNDKTETCLARGEIYLNNDDTENAVRQFLKALEYCKDKKQTFLTICITMMDADLIEDAKEMMTIMLAEFPEDRERMSPYLAMCEYRLGNKKEYLDYIKLAAKADRDTTRLMFGQLYPNVEPEEYYMYAYHDYYGCYPPMSDER